MNTKMVLKLNFLQTWNDKCEHEKQFGLDIDKFQDEMAEKYGLGCVYIEAIEYECPICNNGEQCQKSA